MQFKVWLHTLYTLTKFKKSTFLVCDCALISAFTYFKQLFKLMATWESQPTVALDTVPTAVQQSSRLHAREKDKGEAEQRTTASHIYSPGAVSLSSFWGGVNLLGLAGRLNTTLYWMIQRLCMVRLDPRLNHVKGENSDQAVNFQSDPIRVNPKCDNAHEGLKLLFILE